MEQVLESKPKPEKCEHASINRVIDSWLCNRCGAEFIPKDPRHKTKWQH